MKNKGQGALEYLLLIGGAIVVAVIVIVLLLGTGQSGSAQTNLSVAASLCSNEASIDTDAANTCAKETANLQSTPDDGRDAITGVTPTGAARRVAVGQTCFNCQGGAKSGCTAIVTPSGTGHAEGQFWNGTNTTTCT